jgi:hypothetical protein
MMVNGRLSMGPRASVLRAIAMLLKLLPRAWSIRALRLLSDSLRANLGKQGNLIDASITS